jgi:putative transposase
VADSTFIQLRQEFVYVAIILDAYSRKVVGWALDRSLAAQLVITALYNANASRMPRPGLVHHSDRRSQYASAEYGKVLTSTKSLQV